SALRNEVERVVIPSAKSFGFEFFRLFPRPSITVGAVDVKDHSSTRREMMSLPIKGIADPCSNDRKERVVTANLLDEEMVIVFIIGFEPRTAGRIYMQGVGDKCHVDGNGHDRPDDIE